MCVPVRAFERARARVCVCVCSCACSRVHRNHSSNTTECKLVLGVSEPKTSGSSISDGAKE